jgi:hypothetical protein
MHENYYELIFDLFETSSYIPVTKIELSVPFAFLESVI